MTTSNTQLRDKKENSKIIRILLEASESSAAVELASEFLELEDLPNTSENRQLMGHKTEWNLARQLSHAETPGNGYLPSTPPKCPGQSTAFDTSSVALG